MISLILSFTLLAGTSPPAPAAQPPAPDPGNKMICRRETPIGSLIASRKTCMTAKEWQARAINGNEQARKLVYDGQARNPTPSN